MTTRFLFSNKYKKIGWLILIPALIAGLSAWLFEFNFDSLLQTKVFAIINEDIFSSSGMFKVIENGVFDELVSIFIILGGILVGFSKERDEDEFIASLRSESLVWATYVNYGVLLLTILFVFGMSFFWVLVFNMFTMLLFFILRFNLLLYRNKKSLAHEE